MMGCGQENLEDCTYLRNVDEWNGCYAGAWKGLIVPKAIAHPAKFGASLVQSILDHAFRRGWLAKGDVVLDPFGGIGCGGIICAYAGLRWIGVELEPRFVTWAKESFSLHRSKWSAAGDPHPVIVRGDSRELCDLLAEVELNPLKRRADCVVSSPPYSGNDKHDYLKSEDGRTRAREERRGYAQGRGCFRGSEDAYGQTNGQLGAMNPGDVDAVLSSPPFLDARSETTPSIKGATAPTAHDPEAWSADCVLSSPPYVGGGHSENQVGGWGALAAEKYMSPTGQEAGYGETSGQLGRMRPGDVDAVLSSPPFLDARSETTPSIKGDTAPTAHDPEAWSADCVVSSPPFADAQGFSDRTLQIGKQTVHHGGDGQGGTLRPTGCAGSMGDSSGQLARMRPGDVDAVVSSPPYEASIHDGNGIDRTKLKGNQPGPNSQAGNEGYGQSTGQLGETRGNTFWSAAREIVAQCHAVLKPGGHAIWVTKDFIRDGARVPFTEDWIRLCEACGFELVCRHRAMLVREQTDEGLFERMTRRKSHKSFFRRLAESKGSPAIDWEDVTCFVKRLET